MSEKANGIKDTLGFWFQIICAFILVKTVGFIGCVVSLICYFVLKPKIGILGALISSVILGGTTGIGVMAIYINT